MQAESTNGSRAPADFLQRCKVFACRIYIKLHSMIAPVRVGRVSFGHRFRCDIRDFVQARIYFFHTWEPRLTSFMQQRIRTGDTVVDIGANVGYFSCLMSHLVGGSGSVIAIEASPIIFGQLSANLQENGCRNVRSLNVAVWKEMGEIDLYLEYPRNQGRTTLVSQTSGAHVGTAHCDRFINIVAPFIDDISFIKIDVEGAERPVLEDILANLSRFKRPLNVVAEISAKNNDMIAEFAAAGFACFRLDNVYDIGFYLAAKANACAALEPRLEDVTYPVANLDGDFVFTLN